MDEATQIRVLRSVIESLPTGRIRTVMMDALAAVDHSPRSTANTGNTGQDTRMSTHPPDTDRSGATASAPTSSTPVVEDGSIASCVRRDFQHLGMFSPP